MSHRGCPSGIAYGDRNVKFRCGSFSDSYPIPNSSPPRLGLSDHLIEQSEHRGVTPQVVDVDQRGGAVQAGLGDQRRDVQPRTLCPMWNRNKAILVPWLSGGVHCG
jgi:hypothetical protein